MLQSCSAQDFAASRGFDWSSERATGLVVALIESARVVAITENGMRAPTVTLSAESQHRQRTYLCVSSTCCGLMRYRSRSLVAPEWVGSLVVAPARRSRGCAYVPRN